MKMSSEDMKGLELMAADGRATSEGDWGSERQIEAENNFVARWSELTGIDPESFGITSYNLKATLDEIFDFMLGVARTVSGLHLCRYSVFWGEGYGNAGPEHDTSFTEFYEERWNLDHAELHRIVILELAESWTYHDPSGAVTFVRSK